MKSLVLAEKPSVAKEIARVLKCSSKNKGFIEGPQYVVTWALGHLVTLAEPEDYDQMYKQWKLDDLPMLPASMKLKVIRQTAHQFQVIRNLMRRADIRELVIATDAGREGELVARWIMAQAKWKKPFKRLWISSQTDEAIREGFANLKAGFVYNSLYDAAVCRAEADWLIGLNVTRALSCKFNAQLTAGRVQTPTLAMIVNREVEIKKFVPVDYWTIRVDFGDYFGDWRDRSGKNRIFNLAQAEEIMAKIKGHPGVIKDIHTEGKSEPAPLAYDLTELQRNANKRYGFSAQKTLSVLQNLYEQHKLATYPRTDSRYITRDMVPTLPARLKSIAVGPYAGLVQPLLQKKLMPTKRFVDDSKVTDHHAVIPTGQPLQLATLSTDEKNLFDLIVRRFIAVLYPPYRYDQTTLITVVNSEYFYSRGKVVKELGWRAITARETFDKDDATDDTLPDQSLTMQKKGDQKRVKSCKNKKSKTKPPARYTEATLLTAMESPGKFIEDEELREAVKGSGLGTPATRADIIEKLLYNNYVERQGKYIIPTSKGVQLINLVAPALKTPELTAQWEQRLANIAKGKDSKAEFLAGIRQNALELVQSVIADNAVYKADNISRTKCPLCGKLMLLVKGKRGRMLVCQDRICGHRQPEKQDDFDVFKSSKHASRVNQKLIARYSDQGSLGQNLGELFKVALKKSSDTKQRKNN
ncbi:MAG: DNA topoisomerase III [Desulfotomaculaceae bacterium]|nr:DNA topoisomerase III [Desulfotomaculaceae bacterium]